MPLARRAIKNIKDFAVPVSFKIGEQKNRLRDALNVYSNQGRLETRFGESRFNSTSLGGSPLSVSFFKKTDGTSYLIAKVGTVIYKVNSTGAATSLKTGLTATTKHRGITFNDRHIISVENDGLYSYDGTTFTQLGQAVPASYTATIGAGGSLVDTNKYKVSVTYYSSTIGFESNGTVSSEVTASGGNLQVNLTGLPTTAANAFIDKKRIYIKNTTSNSGYLYVAEIDLATATYSITAPPTSAVVVPTTHATPITGGGKYITEFNRKLVYAGNANYKNDVFFSEEDLPDAFDDTATSLVLNASENGDVTGIATGLYNNSVLEPYLVIFKKKSVQIYSEVGGSGRLVVINKGVGCASHDTIAVKNGDVYFLSEKGWRVISNGRLLADQLGNPITLGNGDIDDIFTSKGFVYEINRATLSGAFSVYYPTLDQYLTWVGEGLNTSFSKVYNYEFYIGGFKPYQFELSATCACLGEDSSGREAVLFADSSGYIHSHSIHESRSDRDSANTEVAISAYAQLFWMPEDGDFDASYNFRSLLIRAISSSYTLTVKTWLNFNINNLASYDYTFPDPTSGFILDTSVLDVDIFGDDRAIVTSPPPHDINRVGESMLIGFYQSTIYANMNLLSAQLNISKNGIRN